MSEDADGRLRIADLPAAAAERLLEPAVLQAIREGLAPLLGRVPEVVVEATGAERSRTPRVTEEQVREQALRALYRQEPRLQRAVEELDLELME